MTPREDRWKLLFLPQIVWGSLELLHWLAKRAAREDAPRG